MEPLQKTSVDVHLDEGLATEILVRLPARSVLSDSAPSARTGSASPHVQPSTPSKRAVARSRPYPTVYLELDALSVTAHRPAARRRLARYVSKREIDFGREYSVMLSSCDGLLLLRSSGADLSGVEQYLVCNPVTRQWSSLPRLSSDVAGANHRESGFYFHEPSGEYRLLCHVTFHVPQAVDWGYYVLSTGANEPRRLKLGNTQAAPMWTTVNPIPSALRPAFYDKLMTPAVLHGHLHWMQHMEGGSTNQMVAFDTVTETFRRMRPPPITPKDLVHSHLLVADGSLMVAELDHQYSVDLWVLKGYDGCAAPGRWERRHRVRVEVPCQSDNRLLVGIGGDGGNVILGTLGGVVAYNVRSRTVRQVVRIDASRGDIIVYPSRVVFRESLVRHGFFDARPHHGLPGVFSFCT
ncbi:unnamed protein product [Alopecurus aequalis]